MYIGKDAKGKEKRDFELVNMIDAAAFYRSSNDKNVVDSSIVPIKSKHDYPLAYTLKIGTMVLLYEKSPEEIWEGDAVGRCKRLYKVVGLSSMRVSGCSYGVIILRYHEEAKPATEIKAKNGAYIQNEDLRPGVKMLHTQLRALVQGCDFDINELGEIKRLR